MKTQVFKTSKVLTLLTGVNLEQDEPINDLVGFLLKTPMGTRATIGALNSCKKELLRQFPTYGGMDTTEMISGLHGELDRIPHDEDKGSYCRVWLAQHEDCFPQGMKVEQPDFLYPLRKSPFIGGSLIMQGGKIGYIG